MMIPLCNPWSWRKKLLALPVRKRSVAILGSTGSIGLSSLQIIRDFPERFQVSALASAGGNLSKLIEQIAEFRPKLVSIENEKAAAICAQTFPDLKIVSGVNGAVLAAQEADVVVAAISGVAGLRSTIAALQNGAIVALANKESIVCGADILAGISTGCIIPVDSEHSSLAQLLMGTAGPEEVSSLTLTASGGPFLQRDLETLHLITPEEAVKHPKWNMGAKVSIDSSTLVNKALEWFEAVYLFGISKVDIVVHPQSIVHACITLRDGTTLANMSYPDMKLPIGFALGVSERLSSLAKPLNLATLGNLTFMAPDEGRFPALSLARQALSQGVFGTCLYSLANEVAVDKFCRKEISYTDITAFIAEALSTLPKRSISSTSAVEELLVEVRSKVTCGTISSASRI